MSLTGNERDRGKGDINITSQFVLAGEAVFTVSNGRGEHFTFKVYSSEPTAQFPRPCWFMKVKNGPEGDDWGYLGRLDVNPDNLLKDPVLLTTAKSRYGNNTPSFRVAQWALRAVWQVGRGSYTVPAGYSLRHEGRCGRCGRPLTHPASLDTGLGAECASLVGVDWQERERRQLPLGPATLKPEGYTDGPPYRNVEPEDMAHPGHPSNYGDN